MKRCYVSRWGYEFPILTYGEEAKRGKTASYKLGVARCGSDMCQ